MYTHLNLLYKLLQRPSKFNDSLTGSRSDTVREEDEKHKVGYFHIASVSVDRIDMVVIHRPAV
jgi:hypothetical protein